VTDLSPEHAILFDQIGERLPLSMIEPPDDGQEQQPKDRYVDHERELMSRPRQEARQSYRSGAGTLRATRSCSVTTRAHLRRLDPVSSGKARTTSLGEGEALDDVRSLNPFAPVPVAG